MRIFSPRIGANKRDYFERNPISYFKIKIFAPIRGQFSYPEPTLNFNIEEERKTEQFYGI